MINLKTNKGITIISLVITIVILTILTGTVISNMKVSNGADNYNKMVADVRLLKDKALIYYNKYGEIPKTNRSINIDGEDYYEIDLSKLDDVTLNFGKDHAKEGNLTNSSDAYVINNSLNVYYLKGVQNSGQMYH